MPNAYSRAAKAQDDSNSIRLQKLLAQAGFGSRRKCEDMITEGRVEVDGELVTELGTRVDPHKQQVRVDGSRVRVNPNHVTLALNKPRKVLSAMDDPKGRYTLRDIVGVQFRNGATLGGSLWRRMGFSDVVAIFLAMDSSVELFKGGVVPLEEFVRMPYDNDILVRLIVKKRPGAFAYQAVRKQRTDLPTLNCAAAKVGEECRVVVGSRPARAMLLRDERGILAGGITEESAAAFADYAAGAVPVSGNMWGSAEYRRALVPVLVRRTLLALGEVR